MSHDQRDEHGDHRRYRFSELVDLERLRTLLDGFSQATGFTTGLVSYPEQELLLGTGWREICTTFHRGTPASEIHCKRSNQELTERLEANRELSIHECESGLIDGATPIILHGQHVANLFTGQVFFEAPDLERFRAQAEAFGYDVEAYLEAVRGVPIVTREAFEKALAFLSELALTLAEQGLAELRQKQTAARLREERLFTETIIDSLPGLFYIFERDSARFYRRNTAWTSVTGYSEAELDELTAPDLVVHPALCVERMQEVFTSGASVMEDDLLLKSGERIPYFFTGRRVCHEGRVFLVGVGLDVSERTEAEAQLRRLRKYLSNIIDSMPSMLIGVDSRGLVTQWNEEARRVTGLSAPEALGRPLSQAAPTLAVEMHRVREAMKTRRVQTETRRPAIGQEGRRCEDVTIYPLVANGVEGVVIRVDDVTERVRLEELMVQSEKMLSVGGLAAGMAHEINNPMAGMMQTAEVLSRRLTGDDIPANRRAAEALGTTMETIRAFMEARSIPRMLSTISESGTRIADIVHNMLSFARKPDMARSTCDMAELLDRTLELAATDYDLKKRYDFKQIEVVKEYEDEVPPVLCERGKIQQVILNILRNGAQAMVEGSGEEPRRPRFVLRLVYERSPGWVRLELEDNGPGMSEQTRKRVFEPFFTTKPQGQGTGLGLSVSYFIITESHGGTLTVRSRPGEGSTFVIRLPG